MTGCGVGYSVEHRYVQRLPPVPAALQPPSRVVVVEDSAAGWATALLDVLEQLWAGGQCVCVMCVVGPTLKGVVMHTCYILQACIH